MTESPPPRPRRLRRLLLPALIAAALAAGGYVWQSREEPGAGATQAATATADATVRPVELAPVEVTRMAPRRLTDVVRLGGSVEPLEQSVVKSEVAATLSEVLVREGQDVRRGDLLARFDTAELTARLNERKSTLEGARAQLALAEKTRTNNLALRKRDIVSQTVLDEALSNFEFQRAQVSALEAQVVLAEKALRDAQVRSPIDGTIAERAVNPGENLAVNARMFVVVDLSRVEVRAAVPADEVARLKPGQPVRLEVDGHGGRRFDGTIARINPVALSGTRSIPVYVIVDNPDRALRGGMFASGDAVVAEADGAFALPPAALRSDAGGDFVLVVEGGRLERRKVQRTGTWSRGELVQVEGLSEGEVVVTANLPGLAAGRAVTLAGT